MTSRFTELTVDCHAPERLAEFWCAVLDFEVIDRREGMVEIGSRVPTAEAIRARQMPPTLVFLRVPEGKAVKNRMHHDVYGDVERLRGLGARVVAEPDTAKGVAWHVMRDPEGNEFCVFAPAG